MKFNVYLLISIQVGILIHIKTAEGNNLIGLQFRILRWLALDLVQLKPCVLNWYKWRPVQFVWSKSQNWNWNSASRAKLS